MGDLTFCFTFMVQLFYGVFKICKYQKDLLAAIFYYFAEYRNHCSQKLVRSLPENGEPRGF